LESARNFDPTLEQLNMAPRACVGTGALLGMVTVETIGRVRHAYIVKKHGIKRIARELRLSRNTVRLIVRGEAREHRYHRQDQPLPQLGAYREHLEKLLEENAGKGPRERLTFQRIYEALRLEGYRGGYDAVRRYGRAWERRHAASQAEAYVPLVFAPGEAYQFDWSHECVVIDGVVTMAKIAHMRLCHSRMPFLRAYPREAQEMVFDAHEKAFAFFKGSCQRGIYDNMKTAVDAVFVGKERAFNRRFLQLMSHHLVEPTACTPAAGWEKGQVENQVGNIRERFFTPRLKFKSYEELNAWLLDRCVAYAKVQAHPEFKDKTVFEVFEAERPALVAYRGPFDGFHETTVAVSKTCLVRFDTNKYSVMAKAVGRPVDVHAYADRIVIKQDGEIVGEHPRRFGKGQVVYDPWHYVPVLARKPGALRNGAPFKDWVLPSSLDRVRRKLKGSDDGDRQMVKILAAVLTDGLIAVEAACAESLAAGVASSDVILNALARRLAPTPPAPILTPERLTLAAPPIADCARYDTLRGAGDTASRSRPPARSEVCHGAL
jgi:transposase